MRICFASVLSVLFLAFAGCSQSEGLSGLSKCGGTVTYNGVPLQGATLTFHPDGGGNDIRAAGAMTGSDGKFTVTTLRPDDGIYPGKYKVTIVKYEEYGPEPNAVLNDYGEMVQPRRPQKNVLPAKYENTATSGIAIIVEKGQSVPLEIDLVD